MHDCPCCGQAVYGDAVVLCGYCRTEGPCAPEAWHCRCGRACDGSACPGEPEPFRNGSVYDRDLLGSGDGGTP